MEICFVCDSFMSDGTSYTVGIAPDDTDFMYDYEFLVCDSCESEIENEESIDELREAMKEEARKDARKQEGVE